MFQIKAVNVTFIDIFWKKIIKSDSKEIYNVTKDFIFNEMLKK